MNLEDPDSWGRERRRPGGRRPVPSSNGRACLESLDLEPADIEETTSTHPQAAGHHQRDSAPPKDSEPSADQQPAKPLLVAGPRRPSHPTTWYYPPIADPNTNFNPVFGEGPQLDRTAWPAPGLNSADTVLDQPWLGMLIETSIIRAAPPGFPGESLTAGGSTGQWGGVECADCAPAAGSVGGPPDKATPGGVEMESGGQ